MMREEKPCCGERMMREEKPCCGERMMREEKPCCDEKMMREEKSCCCEKKAKDCGCMKNDMYHDTDQLPLAMAYVPWQKFSCVYELCDAFKAGTAFPELYKPFNPKGGKCR